MMSFFFAVLVVLAFANGDEFDRLKKTNTALRQVLNSLSAEAEVGKVCIAASPPCPTSHPKYTKSPPFLLLSRGMCCTNTATEEVGVGLQYAGISGGSLSKCPAKTQVAGYAMSEQGKPMYFTCSNGNVGQSCANVGKHMGHPTLCEGKQTMVGITMSEQGKPMSINCCDDAATLAGSDHGCVKTGVSGGHVSSCPGNKKMVGMESSLGGKVMNVFCCNRGAEIQGLASLVQNSEQRVGRDVDTAEQGVGRDVDTAEAEVGKVCIAASSPCPTSHPKYTINPRGNACCTNTATEQAVGWHLPSPYGQL